MPSMMALAHWIARASGARVGDKIQDDVRDLQGVFADPIDVIGTIQLDELGVGNMLSEKPASLNADRRILRSVQHKCGNENRGQDIFDVDLAVHAHQTDHGGRTAAQSFKTAPPALEVRIALF